MNKFWGLKKIGRFFITLSEKNENDLRQSVLLVDGSFILPNNFALMIKDVREKFKNAHLMVLTFKDKEGFIRENFPEVEIIVPGDRIRPKRYALPIQLLFLRKNLKFVILSSLDTFPLLVSLFFLQCPVLLHNRWLEWYRLRLRTLSDVLRRAKSADKKRRMVNKGIKDVVRSFGRIFIILCEVEEESIKSRILIQDNGYTGTGYIFIAVQKIGEIFINPDITLLTLAERKQDFINASTQLKLVVPRENSSQNSLVFQMYRMRKDKFDYVVLTALDPIPIWISFLFSWAKVLLYNRWYQWWSLGPKSIWAYGKGVLGLLVKVPVFIYLLITASLILLSTGFRLGLINLKSIFGGKNEFSN